MSAELIKTIKQKKPTLSELKDLFKKHKITDRFEILGLMMKHNLLQYVKKDKKFLTLKKRANKNIENAYKDFGKVKHVMKSLKNKLIETFGGKIKPTKKNTKKNIKSVVLGAISKT